MRTVVCGLWPAPSHTKRGYGPRDVHYLWMMCRRHLSGDFRFVCMMDGYWDRVDEFPPEVELARWPEEARAVSRLETPEGGCFPSSYRKLWLLTSMAAGLGERILSLDLDCVIRAPIDHLFKDEPFTGWAPTKTVWAKLAAQNGLTQLGGGTWCARPGVGDALWEEFSADPVGTIGRAANAGFRGSDQALLSAHFRGCPLYAWEDGIRTRAELVGFPLVEPKDACLVHFPGLRKPYRYGTTPWVQANFPHFRYEDVRRGIRRLRPGELW